MPPLHFLSVCLQPHSGERRTAQAHKLEEVTRTRNCLYVKVRASSSLPVACTPTAPAHDNAHTHMQSVPTCARACAHCHSPAACCPLPARRRNVCAQLAWHRYTARKQLWWTRTTRVTAKRAKQTETLAAFPAGSPSENWHCHRDASENPSHHRRNHAAQSYNHTCTLRHCSHVCLPENQSTTGTAGRTRWPCRKAKSSTGKARRGKK